MREVRTDYLSTISRAAREVGGIARIVAGPPGWRITIYSVSSPQLAAEILGQPERFRKDAPSYRELRAALGNNMLTSQDEVWHRQRRFLAPIFTPRRIAADYAGIMADEARGLVERWRARRPGAETVDAYPEMVNLTSRVIGRILFGSDVARALPQLRRFTVINNELLRRAVSPHPLARWLPGPGNRRLAAELRLVRGAVDTIIAERRVAPTSGARPDLLGLLLSARDAEEASDRLSDSEVADQVLIFLLAGLETTAMTLACTLTELARTDRWQTILREEARQQLPGGPPTAADVARMPWLGRVIRESMRLRPAAHGMARSARHQEVIAGYRIPSGAWLEVSPWGVHHSPLVWDDPESFDPRRFDVPSGSFPGGHRNAWFPFGTGPRACIGQQLAMLEMQIVLTTILQTFTLTTPLTTTPVHAAITLQPSKVLPIRAAPHLEHRSEESAPVP